MPAVRLVRAHGEGLPDPVRVDELHGQKVRVRHRARVGDSERVLADGLDRPPHVDDLVAAGEEAVGVRGHVVADAVRASAVGLIDVDALDRAAGGGGGGRGEETLVGGLSADGVVEDEDLGGAGAGKGVELV